MKKNNLGSVIIKNNETENSRSEFIDFIVNYFINDKILEVNINNEDFSGERKQS